MSDETRPASRFGWPAIITSAILAGFAPAIAGPLIVDWIKQGVEQQGLAAFWTPVLVPIALFAAFVAAFLLALSLIRRSWREATWIRFGRWVAGVRPVTSRRRDREVAAADTAGWDRREKALQAERARVPQPSWRIVASPDANAPREHRLYNGGYGVRDVRLTVDGEFFELDEDTFFRGAFGDDSPGGHTGRTFYGAPTQRGLDEGVTFAVEWIDRLGDAASIAVKLRPDQLSPVESPVAAYERGREELQAEIDAKRTRPIVRARWLIGPKPESSSGEWQIFNVAAGAVATAVSISTPSAYFVILGKADWDDLHGVGFREFLGHVAKGGRAFGVDFTIEWEDENDLPQSETFHWESSSFM